MLLMIYNLMLVTGELLLRSPCALLLMIYNLMLVTGVVYIKSHMFLIPLAVERRVLVVFGIKVFKSLLSNIKLFCSLR